MADRASEIGLKQGTLAIVPHGAGWIAAFDDEHRRIRRALGDIRATVEHIGSTAVPDLDAKPILDIGIETEACDIEQSVAALVGIGYIDRGVRSGRLLIRLRSGDIRTHNIHLYERGDPDLADQLRFRDRLREDAALRTGYAALKHRIARELGGQRRGYADMKTDFVRAALTDDPASAATAPSGADNTAAS